MVVVRLLLTGALLAFAALPARATAVEWGIAHERWQKADGWLNETYQRLLGQLGPASRDRLIKAELAWIAFRDAEVRFHEDRMRGGSGASTLGEETKADLTVERGNALADQMAAWDRAPGRPGPAIALKNGRQAYQRADAELNRRYKLVVNAIDAPARQLLTRSQLKWIAFRDLEAAFWGHAAAPSPYEAADTQDALTFTTRQRADDFQYLLDTWNSRR